MKVAEIMSRHIEFASPDDAISELAVLMGDLDVGALPIGSSEQLEGVLTDRDILYRVVARGLDPTTVKARDILSGPVITCRAEDSLQDAMDLMAANHIRRLAVVSETGMIEGWITLADLSRKLLVEAGTVQTALRNITADSAD